MSDGFEYGDIILLGLIAAFVALRLRAMMGRNEGADPRELWKQVTRQNAADSTVLASKAASDMAAASAQPGAERNPYLAAVKAADPSFNGADFLAGARLAFEWVINAFAKGDKDKLRALLSPERFEHFCEEIDARATDAFHETTLVSVLASDVTDAQVQGPRARITVQFTSEQISVTRDKDKQVIGGDPSGIEKVIDSWTFERELTSRDPNWKIVAT